MLSLILYFTSLVIWLYWGLEPTLKWTQKTCHFIAQCLGTGKSSELLEQALRELIFNFNYHALPQIGQFKFYSKLVQMLLQQKYQMGIDITAALQELLQSLQQEKKFGAQVRSEFNSSVGQFVVICLVTWTFYLALRILLAMNLSWQQLVPIIWIQFSGLMCFLFCFFWFYHFRFRPYASYFEKLYLSRSLWAANFPINEINRLCAQEEFSPDQKLLPIQYKYQQLMQLAQKYGTVGDSDFNSVISTVWEQQAQDFVGFVKLLTRIKFLHLIGFFVPSYFLLLYFLLERLQF